MKRLAFKFPTRVRVIKSPRVYTIAFGPFFVYAFSLKTVTLVQESIAPFLEHMLPVRHSFSAVPVGRAAQSPWLTSSITSEGRLATPEPRSTSSVSGERATSMTVASGSGSVESVNSRVSSGLDVGNRWEGSYEARVDSWSPKRDSRVSNAWRCSYFASTSWRGFYCPGFGHRDYSWVFCISRGTWFVRRNLAGIWGRYDNLNLLNFYAGYVLWFSQVALIRSRHSVIWIERLVGT